MKKQGNFKWLWVSLLVILADQWTKYLVAQHLTSFHPYHILSFFNISLIYNTGSAFSFLSLASGWQRWFLSVLAIVISTFVFVWLKQTHKDHLFRLIGLACILGGAIGNLIDRLRLGYVIDFIDLHINYWHWPVFNLADSAISIGTMMVIFSILFAQSKKNIIYKNKINLS